MNQRSKVSGNTLKRNLIWVLSVVVAVVALPLLPIPGLPSIGQAGAAECSNVNVTGLSISFVSDGCNYKVLDITRNWEEHCVSWSGSCPQLTVGHEYQVDRWNSSWEEFDKQFIYAEAPETQTQTTPEEQPPEPEEVVDSEPEVVVVAAPQPEIVVDATAPTLAELAAELETQEGFEDSGESALRLLENRVMFNLAENATLFNQFNPVRASLSGDELASYDASIERIRYVFSVRGRERTSPDGRMDPSMSYLLATTLMEGFWPNVPAAEQAVMGVGGRWNINEDIRGVALCDGLHQGFVEIDVADVMITSTDRHVQPDNNSDLTVMHEAAHAYACDKTLFTGDESSSELGLIYRRMQANYESSGDLGGLSEYAYTKDYEFWAEAVSFMTTGSKREQIRQQSPDLYTWLKNHFGWTHLPDA